MSDSQPKWICEYCTYENYPSSLKCTMCRGAKPFVSEDIYQLRGKDEKYSSNTSLSGLAAAVCDNKPKKGKWTCETCTFLNTSKEQASFYWLGCEKSAFCLLFLLSLFNNSLADDDFLFFWYLLTGNWKNKFRCIPRI